jgi:hypothetical protein
MSPGGQTAKRQNIEGESNERTQEKTDSPPEVFEPHFRFGHGAVE